MPTEKPKTATESKEQLDKSKRLQASELDDDELKSVTGGVSVGGGVTSTGASTCISQT